MKFSIIIPVYNVAPYLRECLDSILAQTFPVWEAICVDDGSSDGSGQILDEYATNDLRFKVIHKNNEGVSIARNTAIEIASGDYIGFVDADDVIAIDWLFHAKECFDSTDADVVRFEIQRWDGQDCENPVWSNEYRIISNRKELIEWGWTKYLSDNCGGPCNVFVKRCMVRNYATFPPGMRMKEDRIFLLRLLMKTNMMVCSDYQGYFYRYRNDGACGSQRKVNDVLRYMEEIKNLSLEFREEIIRQGAETTFQKAITWTLINDIEELVMQGDESEWKKNIEISTALSTFHNKSLLRLRYVQIRYILSTILSIKFKSMIGFVQNKKLYLLYKKYRSCLQYGHSIFHN